MTVLKNQEYNYSYSIEFNYLYQERHWKHLTKINYNFVKVKQGIKITHLNFMLDRKGVISEGGIELSQFHNKIFPSLRAYCDKLSKIIIDKVIPKQKINGQKAKITEPAKIENKIVKQC